MSGRCRRMTWSVLKIIWRSYKGLRTVGPTTTPVSFVRGVIRWTEGPCTAMS